MPVAPPPAAAPAADRLPDSLATGTPEALRADLERDLGEDRVLSRVIDLVRYASDASPYRLVPQAVVMAHDVDDVCRTLAYGRRHGIPVTLRGGGTSLNGQGQTDGILVDVRRHWAGFRILEDGAAVRVKPGTVLGRVNRALHRFGRRLGPDPASTDIATLGGVIANNSGGMRCGVVADSYRTLRSLSFILPSGTAVDTAQPDAAEHFATEEPELAAGLAQIRDEIRADAELCARIRRKFEIKNTMGYRLCAFLDADEPLEIFQRLLVGSEGTLAFITEAVMETVPHGRHTSTGMIFFEDLEAAARPVPDMVAAGATAVELMVNASLIAAAYNLPGVPAEWQQLPPDGAVLLVELRTADEAELDGLEAKARSALEQHSTAQPPVFTRDPHETEVFWLVREGMQGILGLIRPQGAHFLIEDVCVPPEHIADSARDIRALLAEHQFLPGVAGHASAGNLHFLLMPDLTKDEDRERYEAFMTKLVELIVDRYDGSLKAEHGTGRNMAPYVEREWGAKATEIMWRIKRLADPEGVLNPGVVLSEDPGIHLKALKSTPPIEDVARANTCIECGFCEPVCPSRHLTTTPRQRIVVRREMARQPEGSPVRAALAEQYQYDGLDTCAADGSCRIVCPLGIDTGKLVKHLRTGEHSRRAEKAAAGVARRYALVERAARVGLRTGRVAARTGGDAAVGRASDVARRVAGAEHLPRWSEAVPGAAPRLPRTDRPGAAAVYLPSCTNRIFGNSRSAPDGPSLPAALVEVSRRAGRPLWIPPDVGGHCCAVPWSSKGYAEGHRVMAARTAASLWRWTDGGALPVVIDATSCALGVVEEMPEALATDAERERLAQVRILDSVQWAQEELLPRLEIDRKARSATVHPTCSARHLGVVPALEAVARACAEEVNVPLVATCCGMAGDRGLLHPELPASAVREEAAEVREHSFQHHLTANRTCEIGLEQATGFPYRSVVHLLEEVTRGS